MSINRRELITGAAAMSAVLLPDGKASAETILRLTGTKGTVVRHGALSGGGYIQNISISDDGQTMVIGYDGRGGWIWNDGASQWEFLITQSSVPEAYRTWGQSLTDAVGFSLSALAVAPSDNNRIYVVACSGAAAYQGLIWRSTNRGVNFTDTGFRIAINTAAKRWLGPPIAVDPINPDIVYISNDAGAIYRTTDGFVSNFTCLSRLGGPLAGVLSSAVATENTAYNRQVITVDSIPANVSTRNGFIVYGADTSRFDGIATANYVSATAGNTIKFIYQMNQLGPGTSGVRAGDNLVFGGRAGIAFDRSSSTVGGKTQGIYIGWSYGASHVYHSIDGGSTFAATKGGPAITQNICVSSDGVIYAVENTSSSTYLTGTWKYQSGTWTNFSIASRPGNIWAVCAADPNNRGHVAFAMWDGHLQFSSDYGASWYKSRASMSHASPDVAWMNTSGTKETWMSVSPIVFDPVVSGRLWFCEGIGIWYTSPPIAPGADPAIVWTGRNKGQQTLIVDQILKPPGQPLVLAVQDRAGFQIKDVTQEPKKDFGMEFILGNSINHGWAIDYAKSNPAFQICIVGTYAWKSADAGGTWTRIKAQPKKVNAGGAVAVQTASNFVWFPSNNGTPAYTRDGGTTWIDCLFNGATMSNGWGFSLYLNRHIVCADLVDAETYYAYNYNNNSTGGVWRSVDGGANWENMSGGIGRLLNSGSPDFQLISIPGHRGHLMFGGGSGVNKNFPLMRSVDAGATWHQVASTKVCWQPAAGKQAPGGLYPAIFFSGAIAGDSRPGLFRSDYFTADPADIPTWTRLCYAPAGNIDAPKCLCADYDEYGTFYLGFGTTGYAVGTIE